MIQRTARSLRKMSEYISRKEAIALWDKYRSTIAVDAIEYDAELRKLPSAQLGTNLAEVGTDLAQKTVKGYPIDADGLLEKVTDEYGIMARDRLYRIIRNMPKYKFPPADVVQVRHGNWTLVGWHKGMKVVECSCCKKRAIGATDFCPHCGAKMDGGKNG